MWGDDEIARDGNHEEIKISENLGRINEDSHLIKSRQTSLGKSLKSKYATPRFVSDQSTPDTPDKIID